MVFLVVGSDGTCDVHWQRALSGSFIEPLEERKVGLELPNGGRWRGPGGESCSTASVAESELGIADASHRPKIIISVTTFENGTHEGDDIYAAMLDAARFGTETEQQRITAIVENTLERVGSDDTAIK